MRMQNINACAGQVLERLNGKSVSKVFGGKKFADISYIHDMMLEVRQEVSVLYLQHMRTCISPPQACVFTGTHGCAALGPLITHYTP